MDAALDDTKPSNSTISNQQSAVVVKGAEQPKPEKKAETTDMRNSNPTVSEKLQKTNRKSIRKAPASKKPAGSDAKGTGKRGRSVAGVGHHRDHHANRPNFEERQQLTPASKRKKVVGPGTRSRSSKRIARA